MLTKETIADWFKGLQDRICVALETEDGTAKFEEELWERPGGGGGRTRVIQHGTLFEKGGVNFSAVHGELSDKIALGLKIDKGNFFATGVSIVIHPNNPNVPIIHMNVRYFELDNGLSWFGGGIDLTPHYVNVDDAKYFHSQLKNTCKKYNENYYPDFKKWADDYFFIKHRNETRGIGGIFFDRLSANQDFTKEQRFEFVKAVGETFAPTYIELVKRNKNKEFGPAQKKWQLIRRGRYVEFNLVYDAGTKFGLETDGRIESILMSLPENASWFYNFITEKNSAEEHTLSFLKKGINWV
jgi:coproporphyrinogen III oxidase